MIEVRPIDDRPIRVVMFGSGPILTHEARRFLCRLEAHPAIDLLAAFCQAKSRSWIAFLGDLWRRRRVLAVPLFIAWVVNNLRRYVAHPCQELSISRELVRLESRLRFVPDIHSADVTSELRALRPDLGVVYGSPILKPEVFDSPALGTLGIHHGKVPEYRGNKTTFWAMYNGEEHVGVTIQKINAGLDTGTIVKEGQVAIGRRSLRAVWSELEDLGLDLYLDAILEVKGGTATFKPQKGPKGQLYKNPKPRDFLHFWGRQIKRRLAKV